MEVLIALEPENKSKRFIYRDECSKLSVSVSVWKYNLVGVEVNPDEIIKKL